MSLLVLEFKEGVKRVAVAPWAGMSAGAGCGSIEVRTFQRLSFKVSCRMSGIQWCS